MRAQAEIAEFLRKHLGRWRNEAEWWKGLPMHPEAKTEEVSAVLHYFDARNNPHHPLHTKALLFQEAVQRRRP